MNYYNMHLLTSKCAGTFVVVQSLCRVCTHTHTHAYPYQWSNNINNKNNPVCGKTYKINSMSSKKRRRGGGGLIYFIIIIKTIIENSITHKFYSLEMCDWFCSAINAFHVPTFVLHETKNVTNE